RSPRVRGAARRTGRDEHREGALGVPDASPCRHPARTRAPRLTAEATSAGPRPGFPSRDRQLRRPPSNVSLQPLRGYSTVVTACVLEPGDVGGALLEREVWAMTKLVQAVFP